MENFGGEHNKIGFSTMNWTALKQLHNRIDLASSWRHIDQVTSQ